MRLCAAGYQQMCRWNLIGMINHPRIRCPPSNEPSPATPQHSFCVTWSTLQNCPPRGEHVGCCLSGQVCGSAGSGMRCRPSQLLSGRPVENSAPLKALCA